MGSPSSQNHRRGLKAPPPAAYFAAARVAKSAAPTLPSTKYQTLLPRHGKSDAIVSGLTDFSSQSRLQILKIAFLFHIDGYCAPSIWTSYLVKSISVTRASRSLRTFSLI